MMATLQSSRALRRELLWLVNARHSMMIVFLACCSAGAAPGDRLGYPGAADPFRSRAESDYWLMWRGFKLNTEALSKTWGRTNAEAAALLHQIQTNTAFLEKKWNDWFIQHRQYRQSIGSDDYLAALQGDDRLLRRARKEEKMENAMEAIRDAVADVQIKADHCRKSGDGLGKQIRIKVHTKIGGEEVGGYEVFYVSKGMYDVKSAHDRFPRESSPTDERSLAPGRYAIWVRKNTFISEPIFLRLGGEGESRLEVDIPVPTR